MTEAAGEPTGWRALADAGRWSAIDIYDLSDADAAALLARLREVVPIIVVSDGMEEMRRHARPDEATLEQEATIPGVRDAAAILQLGELEALVEGEPAPAIEVWRDSVATALRFLVEARREDRRDPEGAAELARATHITEAAEALREVRTAMRLIRQEAADEDEARWLDAALAEVAVAAFLAGRRVQAVWGKPIEYELIKGKRARQKGGKSRRHPDHDAIMEGMRRRIEQGMSIRHAARATFEVDRKGPGPAANETRWYESNPKR